MDAEAPRDDCPGCAQLRQEVQALREQLDNQLQSQTKQAQAMERAYQSLSDIAEERRALIASLETRLSGLEMQLIDAAAPILPRSLDARTEADQPGGEAPAPKAAPSTTDPNAQKAPN